MIVCSSFNTRKINLPFSVHTYQNELLPIYEYEIMQKFVVCKNLVLNEKMFLYSVCLTVRKYIYLLRKSFLLVNRSSIMSIIMEWMDDLHIATDVQFTGQLPHPTDMAREKCLAKGHKGICHWGSSQKDGHIVTMSTTSMFVWLFYQTVIMLPSLWSVILLSVVSTGLESLSQ